MTIGQEIPVFNGWFYLKFIENPGMAFGWDIPLPFGKLILSIIRIIAVIAIGYYLFTLIKNNATGLLITSMSLIFAGAIGNIIDSAFYGLIFSESTYFSPAELFPADGGYATFLHGKVVDMLYFPLIQGYYPDWFPFVGGKDFLFFRPIFNIADSSITIGVLIILLFQKRMFKQTQEKESTEKSEETPVLEATEHITPEINN